MAKNKNKNYKKCPGTDVRVWTEVLQQQSDAIYATHCRRNHKLRQEHNIAGAEIRDDLRSVLTQKDTTQSWRKEAGLRNKR